MFFYRLNLFLSPRRTSLIAATLVTSSMALVACGGSGGGTGGAGQTANAKPVELSLVAGTLQTFNGTGAQARISSPKGVAIDTAGNTYITQSGLHSLRKITPAGVVTVVAGDPVDSGSADGVGVAARFSTPGAIAIDKNDNIYVIDNGNYAVRKVSPSGMVSTLAGSAGLFGPADQTAPAAYLNLLSSIAVDSNGSVFVRGIGAVRKMAVDGSVVTLVVPADVLGDYAHLAADSSGNLFIASSLFGSPAGQQKFGLLYKLTSTGALTQVYDFSTKESEVLNFGGIALDGVGNIYLSNGNHSMSTTTAFTGTYVGNRVLKLSAQGVLTTLAGTLGESGSTDGQGASARFNEPGNLAANSQGNVVVADVRNGTLRLISGSGAVSTLAGRASYPYPVSIDGQGTQAQLGRVVGLASDQKGNVVVAEEGALRSLSPSGMLTTLNNKDQFSSLALDSRGFIYSNSKTGLGIGYETRQYTRYGELTGKIYLFGTYLAVDALDNLYGAFNTLVNLTTQKKLAELGGYVTGMTFDAVGNAYLVDPSRSIVLKVSPGGVVSTLAGMDGKPGYKDGIGATAQFNGPRGVATLGTDVYISDTGNNSIRKISQDGNVTTLVGTRGSLQATMGQAGSLYQPTYLATESNNSLLVINEGRAIVRIRLP